MLVQPRTKSSTSDRSVPIPPVCNRVETRKNAKTPATEIVAGVSVSVLTATEVKVAVPRQLIWEARRLESHQCRHHQ